MPKNWNSERPRELFLFTFNKIYTEQITNERCKSKTVSIWHKHGGVLWNFCEINIIEYEFEILIGRRIMAVDVHEKMFQTSINFWWR